MEVGDVKMELERKAVKNMRNINWERPTPGYIRLSFGENYSKIPQCIPDAIIEELNLINLYPDSACSKARERIAKYVGISADKIIVDNGIDGILDIIAKTFIEKGDEIIIPVPTFPTYRSVSELMEGRVKNILLNEDFCLDIDKLIDSITNRTKLIFIANPNNPTGNILLERDSARKILDKFDGILILDECYFEICRRTNIDLVNHCNNLIVTRSFSKALALAGLRIGYAIGSKYLINPMNRVVDNCSPFRLDRLAQSASKILELPEEIERLCEDFRCRKMLFFSGLEKIPHISVVNTDTSFLLIRVRNKNISVESIKNALEKKRIIIRNCNIYDNMPSGYILSGIPAEEDISYVVSSIHGAINLLIEREGYEDK